MSQAQKKRFTTLLVIPAFAFSLAGSPTASNATDDFSYDELPTLALQEAPLQNFTANENELSDATLEYMALNVESIELIETATYETVELDSYDFSDSNFDVQSTIALAYSEVGTSRPTGWSAEGECIMSVKRWIAAGNGNWGGGGGTPVGNYINAKRVNVEDIRPGDVMQYVYASSPTSWVSGVHTVLITGVNGDGTYKIVESNNPGGSGLVSMNDHWTPTPPPGFEAHYYRF